MHRLTQLLCFLCAMAYLGAAQAEDKASGWFILKWMEKPSANGPSKQASPEDLAQFKQVHVFDHGANDAAFKNTLDQLREGDVLAYRMGKWEARKKIFTGKLNNVAYRLYKYGHLAIVVRDPEDMSKLRIFSSESFKGPNMREGLDTLKTHSFDVYRLDKWSRVDTARLNEFVQLSMKKAGAWYGYDFSGMFGLWNSNLTPKKPEDIGQDALGAAYLLRVERSSVMVHAYTSLISTVALRRYYRLQQHSAGIARYQLCLREA